MEPLFIFGTLQHRPLLEAVLGHSEGIILQASELPGYRVSSVTEGPFPMIVPAADCSAPGLLISGLTSKDYDRLDYYEAAFGYHLVDVQVSGGKTSKAYFPPAGKWTENGSWDIGDWVHRWGALSVLAAAEVMTYEGVKTPAEISVLFPIIRARAWSTLNAKLSKHGALTLHGSVQVDEVKRPYANYFSLDEYCLKHERFDGSMSETLMRAVFRAPDATLVLPYDPYRDRVLLVEQVRLGPLARGDETIWQLEPVAGRLDAGELPEEAARREAIEEAGLKLGELIPVAETYCSPGNSSEFYYIYVGIADLPESAAGVGGVPEEHEDIRSHVISFDTLMDMCDGLKFCNAPLVMASYWLARHRGRLREQAGIR